MKYVGTVKEVERTEGGFTITVEGDVPDELLAFKSFSMRMEEGCIVLAPIYEREEIELFSVSLVKDPPNPECRFLVPPGSYGKCCGEARLITHEGDDQRCDNCGAPMLRITEEEYNVFLEEEEKGTEA